jgi:hypothetical protein
MSSHEGSRLGLALLSIAASLATGCGATQTTQAATDDGEEYYVSGDEAGQRAAPNAARPADGGASVPARGAPPVLVRREPRCSGTYDCDAAGLEIFGLEEQLGACYEEAGAARAGRGVVYALLDVQPEGDVHGVLIGYSDVRSAGFMDCLERELGTLSMPASQSTSVVQALLVFGARDQAEGREMLAAYRTARAASESDEPVPTTAIRQSVQSCYERQFRSREAPAGRIVLSLTTHEDGRVESVAVTEDAFGGQLDECVVDVVGKLHLSLEEGAGTSLVYPVVLQPGAGSSPPAPAPR